MKLSRDAWLAIGLLLALVLVTIGAGYQQSKAATIPYLSTSSASDGMLALHLWLPELDHQTVTTDSTAFQPPKDADLIFIVQPALPIEEREWNLLDKWIEAGGTLLIAGDNYASSLAFNHFDASTSFANDPKDSLRAASPLLTSPLLLDPAPVRAYETLSSTPKDFIPLLVVDGRAVIGFFDKGQGRVLLSSTPYPFSNQGLKDDANAALLLNLLRFAPPQSRVWLDDWHHGIQSAPIVGPGQWLRRTSAGHALLFVAGIIFFALLLQGGNFGRPIPLLHEIKRRGPMEHVTAIANLNRKAGHRADVLRQYHHWIKRHLGQRYRLNPSLPDEEYVAQLVKYNPALDKEKLLNLLHDLSRTNPTESEMVKLAEEASKWINE
jgi:hypothetical protein